MIVFDLRCDGGHVFEAWFGSSGDYADQKARKLLNCPICGDAAIEKAVMAPNVGTKGNKGNRAAATQPPAVPASLPAVPEAERVKRALAELAKAQARVLAESEWVGRGFAREARAIHDGDSDRRSIHGEASLAEVKSLLDDGIGVAPLPLPLIPDDKRN
ncbi:DUF1178 family protein [Sphingomonas sanxanigenens]|uniref:Uncharacterized protein n=1 Tax=Sphingomonas sanxanigenens DSM 19645 = NX02 TaxID=1123269 RepID=W0A9W6_9SPHN|nr:DUF1178 family protein [Sphingomonas sanxanigenens]AHE53886.1 hypothetical protein NX02_10860 [Sphingomonas sanxanigenens DSM 19645 = NX02]